MNEYSKLQERFDKEQITPLPCLELFTIHDLRGDWASVESKNNILNQLNDKLYQKFTKFRKDEEEMRDPIRAFEKASVELANAFAVRFGYSPEPDAIGIEDFIGEDPSGILEILDEYWCISDIYRAMNSDIEAESLQSWYYETIEGGYRENQKINLKSWIMGLRYDQLK